MLIEDANVEQISEVFIVVKSIAHQQFVRDLIMYILFSWGRIDKYRARSNTNLKSNVMRMVTLNFASFP